MRGVDVLVVAAIALMTAPGLRAAETACTDGLDDDGEPRNRTRPCQ